MSVPIRVPALELSNHGLVSHDEAKRNPVRAAPIVFSLQASAEAALEVGFGTCYGGNVTMRAVVEVTGGGPLVTRRRRTLSLTLLTFTRTVSKFVALKKL